MSRQNTKIQFDKRLKHPEAVPQADPLATPAGFTDLRAETKMFQRMQHTANEHSQKRSPFSKNKVVAATHQLKASEKPHDTQSEVIQLLMKGTDFQAKYTHVGTAKTGSHIAALLTKYESEWGVSIYGIGEYNGKVHRQNRLRILADLTRSIHEHFRDSGTTKISQAPESKLMLELLDEVQAEHETQIGQLLSHKDELPVDDRKLDDKAKKTVLKNWKSIVDGTGNLKVHEKEKDKGTGLERDHPGFRVKTLSNIARLMQGKKGREIIDEANEDGSDASKHVHIEPISNKDHDVMEGFFFNRKKKGTISAAGWDAEALDSKKDTVKPAKKYATGTFWNLDKDVDPIKTYELAGKRHHSKGTPDGVILDQIKYVFNTGTGSLVRAVMEHKDSENRVMTHENGQWREGLSPTSVALGHELGHAVHNRRGVNADGGRGNFLKAAGYDEEKSSLWTNSDEELVNITQVENKLLKEQGLHPRKYHKDYQDTLQEKCMIRLVRYNKGAHCNAKIVQNIYKEIDAHNLVKADLLLREQGY